MAKKPSIRLGFDKIQRIFLVEAALTHAGYDTASVFLCEAMLLLAAMGASTRWSREDFQELAGNAYDWAKAMGR